MYLDGNEYRFIHRSFQEYFAAYYFTTLMDDEYKDIYEVLTALDYKIASDETISMLCGLDQKRFERYVVIPLLEEIFGYNNDEEDYKSFIRKYYSEIEYVTGTLDDEMANNSIQSAIVQIGFRPFITSKNTFTGLNLVMMSPWLIVERNIIAYQITGIVHTGIWIPLMSTVWNNIQI